MATWISQTPRQQVFANLFSWRKLEGSLIISWKFQGRTPQEIWITAIFPSRSKVVSYDVLHHKDLVRTPRPFVVFLPPDRKDFFRSAWGGIIVSPTASEGATGDDSQNWNIRFHQGSQLAGRKGFAMTMSTHRPIWSSDDLEHDNQPEAAAVPETQSDYDNGVSDTQPIFVSTGSTVGKITLEGFGWPRVWRWTWSGSYDRDTKWPWWRESLTWQPTLKSLCWLIALRWRYRQLNCHCWLWQPALHYNLVKLKANHRAKHADWGLWKLKQTLIMECVACTETSADTE